jgi:ankyrin repeat protein
MDYVNRESEGYQKRERKRQDYVSNVRMQSSNSESLESNIHIQEAIPLTNDQKDMIAKLFLSVNNSTPDEIIALLKDNVLPNVPNEEKDYPIHVAMLRKDALDVVKAFFDVSYKYTPNINVQNKEGRTSLHLAILNRNNELILYLPKKGALPNLQDHDGNTALHLIAMDDKGISAKTLEVCLDYGGRIDIQNKLGKICPQLSSDVDFQRLFMEFKFDRNTDVVGGDIEVGLAWKNLNDLDLHCYCRCENHIQYSNKKCTGCRGYLDWDMNVSPDVIDNVQTSLSPVEHIYWPHVTPGRFVITVKYFRNHNGIERDTEYFVFMNVKGENIFQAKGVMSNPGKEIIVFGFNVDEEKVITVIDKNNLTIPEKSKREHVWQQIGPGSRQQIRNMESCYPVPQQQILSQYNNIETPYVGVDPGSIRISLNLQGSGGLEDLNSMPIMDPQQSTGSSQEGNGN